MVNTKRVSRPTEKMQAYQDSQEKSKARKDLNEETSTTPTFDQAYTTWKIVMRSSRLKLKENLNEEGLVLIIEETQQKEKAVIESFKALSLVPDQITRQRMDGCSSNTKKLIALALLRMSEVDMDPWDDDAEQARLHNMFDVD